jgi:hypothetical protein
MVPRRAVAGVASRCWWEAGQAACPCAWLRGVMEGVMDSGLRGVTTLEQPTSHSTASTPWPRPALARAVLRVPHVPPRVLLSDAFILGALCLGAVTVADRCPPCAPRLPCTPRLPCAPQPPLPHQHSRPTLDWRDFVDAADAAYSSQGGSASTFVKVSLSLCRHGRADGRGNVGFRTTRFMVPCFVVPCVMVPCFRASDAPVWWAGVAANTSAG